MITSTISISDAQFNLTDKQTAQILEASNALTDASVDALFEARRTGVICNRITLAHEGHILKLEEYEEVEDTNDRRDSKGNLLVYKIATWMDHITGQTIRLFINDVNKTFLTPQGATWGAVPTKEDLKERFLITLVNPRIRKGQSGEPLLELTAFEEKYARPVLKLKRNEDKREEFYTALANLRSDSSKLKAEYKNADGTMNEQALMEADQCRVSYTFQIVTK